MNLDQNISELLYHYDCVILPELGGFVTNYHPAQLDEHSSIFSPPYKAISFNSYLKSNDGLLSNYISQKESLSFEEVNVLLKEKVEEYFAQLNNGERVVFDKVGILYMDKSQKIQFSPDSSCNYLLNSFGLRNVYAHAEESKVHTPFKIPTKKVVEEKIVQLKEKTPIIALNPDYEDVDGLDEGLRRRIWRSAAVILPIALLMGYFVNDPLDQSNQHLSELNPFKDSVVQTYEKRESIFEAPEVSMNTDFPDLFELPAGQKTILFSLTDNKDDAIPVSLSNKVRSKKTNISGTKKTYASDVYFAPSEIKTLKFHVIAGCFGEKRNAEKKVRRLRKNGFDGFILDKRKGLYRVVYGSFAKRNQALILLQAVKQNEDRQAWLLRI